MERTYKLTVMASVPNPDYKPPKSLREVYGERYDIPRVLSETLLSVEVSQEQWEAIRAAVLERFK